jgi:hypothetical protein
MKRSRLTPINEGEFKHRYGGEFFVPHYTTMGWFANEEGVLGIMVADRWHERWGCVVFCREEPVGVICVAKIDISYGNRAAAETALGVAIADETARRTKRTVAL